jgi:hypothetical protein
MWLLFFFLHAAAIFAHVKPLRKLI